MHTFFLLLFIFLVIRLYLQTIDFISRLWTPVREINVHTSDAQSDKIRDSAKRETKWKNAREVNKRAKNIWSLHCSSWKSEKNGENYHLLPNAIVRLVNVWIWKTKREKKLPSTVKFKVQKKKKETKSTWKNQVLAIFCGFFRFLSVCDLTKRQTNDKTQVKQRRK